ncbi:XRE family transcriptional regulator [Siminovitchia fortis]|uniref:ImmA/IrrE family metallo-endopeptidase n=1 Tax=Siminovitchia fortis TaxID=254758 RepID=A0A443IVM9_9BACI|nr:XRE family transcriptional regulator [Siminovitchia fortis]RWR12188.1 ImmA/IrrE family metallo-endopeptidase [Siminovitchia fortis]WHY80975.1 XRE family transcriptional regulator [Siminovitchia fortis]
MFVGEKLTDIRLLHGYSRNELGNLLGVSEQSVWQYENNYISPKLEVVNKLKAIFNVKTKYFYTKESFKTKFDAGALAFRSKGINSIAKTKYEAAHLEFIEGLLNIFEGYITYPPNNLISLRDYSIKYLNENTGQMDRKAMIKHLAEHAREFLGVGENNQKLLFALEKNGAFVFEKSLGADVDAYSAWSKSDKPMILLGKFNKSAVRRNLDLAHELGHLLLHYKMDLSDLSKSEYKEKEEDAYDFASYFLMPEEEFKKDMMSIKKLSNPNSYIDLKEKWSVSIAAMAYYARRLGYLTYQQHRYFYASMNRQNYNQAEPLDDKIKIIRPGKVKSSLEFLMENNILTLRKLMELTHYNETLIAKILGLDESFIRSYIEQPAYFDVSYISEKREGYSPS